MTSSSVPGDLNAFKTEMLFCYQNCMVTDGAILGQTNGLTGDQGKEQELRRVSFKAKNIAMWPDSIGGMGKLGPCLVAIKNVSPVQAGEAEVLYQTVIGLMMDVGIDVEPYLRSQVMVKVETGGYKIVGGKVTAVVDLKLFKDQVLKLRLVITDDFLRKGLLKQMAEQNFFELIKTVLEGEPEAYKLIGILAARLLLDKGDRDSVDKSLEGITVLKNKTGKLSVGLVRMGGFMGLGTVKDVPALGHAMKFIKNPLLDEEVEDRPILQRSEEDEKSFTARKDKHIRGFQSYKAIMVEMKSYSGEYKKMPQDMKLKMREAVLAHVV